MSRGHVLPPCVAFFLSRVLEAFVTVSQRPWLDRNTVLSPPCPVRHHPDTRFAVKLGACRGRCSSLHLSVLRLLGIGQKQPLASLLGVTIAYVITLTGTILAFWKPQGPYHVGRLIFKFLFDGTVRRETAPCTGHTSSGPPAEVLWACRFDFSLRPLTCADSAVWTPGRRPARMRPGPRPRARTHPLSVTPSRPER